MSAIAAMPRLPRGLAGPRCVTPSVAVTPLRILGVGRAGVVRAVPEYLSEDTVKSVFTTFNSITLIPWGLMVLLPTAGFTKAFIRSNVPLLGLCALYAWLFIAATAQSVDAGCAPCCRGRPPHAPASCTSERWHQGFHCHQKYHPSTTHAFEM